MLDLINFTTQFEHSSIKEYMKQYFDENMVMYKIIGHCEGIDVSAKYDNISIIYTVSSDQANKLTSLVKNLQNSLIDVYGNTFKINIIQNNGKLNISVDKVLV